MSTETITADERFTYLATWAAKNGCALELEGEVGFGRECVGIMKGTAYLDYAHLWDEYPDEEFWTPDDSYHKHPCLAVLGRGEDATEQLYQWVKWLDEHGWTVETVERRPEHALDAMFHGFETYRLAKRSES